MFRRDAPRACKPGAADSLLSEGRILPKLPEKQRQRSFSNTCRWAVLVFLYSCDLIREPAGISRNLYFVNTSDGTHFTWRLAFKKSSFSVNMVHDVSFCHIVPSSGSKRWLDWRREVELLSDLVYFGLTTFSGTDWSNLRGTNKLYVWFIFFVLPSLSPCFSFFSIISQCCTTGGWSI